METLTLKTAITFDEPIEKVWKGLTDPKLVKQYFFGTELSSDFKKGGRITFSGEWDGHKYEDGGTILEIDPPKVLKYSYWSSMSGTEDKPENYHNVTYELDEKNSVTTLVISQDGVKSRESMEHSENNWQSIFDALKQLLKTIE
jgi:uncharacterized protein YndB with AHSA1/START domain